MIEYRSIADLAITIRKNLHLIPKDIDLIVGIPRSGLLVANLIALYLNKPLTDVDGLLANRVFESGRRLPNKPVSLRPGSNVLMADDSIYSGAQLQQVKERMSRASLPYQFTYLAVYANEARDDVDIFFDIVKMPRVFEWNLLHHSLLQDSCVDIDGFLCRDPTPEENDDSDNYREFLTTVEPLYVPSVPLGWIVTCRLEKYRRLTQQWLTQHGITYQKLIMMDMMTKEERIKSGYHAEYKAAVYAETKAHLFIESSLTQAREIALRTSRDVFCSENWSMISPRLDLAETTEDMRWILSARLRLAVGSTRYLIAKPVLVLKSSWRRHGIDKADSR